MKKVKLLAPTLTIVGLTSIATPIITLTSCGNKNVNLIVTGDSHYKSYTTREKVRKDTTFFIIPTMDENYIIDSSKTKLTCGNQVLVLGTDYTINTGSEIMVNPNKVTTTDVEVYIATKSATQSFTQEYVEGKGLDYEGILFLAVDETLTKDDIKIFANKYDGSKEQLTWGTGEGQVHFLYKEEDITESFVKDGFKIKEEMMDIDPTTQKRKITQVNIKYSVMMPEGKAGSETMMLYAGYKPEYISWKETSGTSSYIVGHTYFFEVTAKPGAFSAGKFKLLTGEEYAELSEDGELKCKATGVITFEAQSYYNPKATCEGSITIVAG